jgi:hypothetical protein
MNYSTTQLDFLTNKKSVVFICFCLLSIALFFLAQQLLVSDDLYYDLLGEQLTYEKITEVININKQWSWIAYPLMPVYYLLKFVAVALTVYMGVILMNYSISFGKIFSVVMFSEFVFLLPTVLKILWFQFFQVDYTLSDLQTFSPLSIMSLFDGTEVDQWLVYPLQLLNIFEVLYCLILAYGLRTFCNERYSNMILLVLATYGTGLVIWIIFSLFLNVTFLT